VVEDIADAVDEACKAAGGSRGNQIRWPSICNRQAHRSVAVRRYDPEERAEEKRWAQISQLICQESA
jgi:hypothetical protein